MIISHDPLNSYSHMSPQEIFETCGILPHWVAQWEASGLPDLPNYMQKCYGYETSHLEGATITPEGMFQFPGDPDLPPMIRIDLEGTTYFQYPYALLAIRTQDSTFITRMD